MPIVSSLNEETLKGKTGDNNDVINIADQDTIVELQKAFQLFDKNRDGSIISVQEMVDVIRSLDQNPTKEELKQMIQQLNAHSNSTFQFSHFFTLLTPKIKEEKEREEELKEAFKVFDKDQNGFISPNELRNVMINLGEKLTEEEAAQMIKEADLDGDGQVSFYEFSNILMTNL